MLRRQKVCLSKLLGAPFDFLDYEYKSRHPVLLECGHSMCEACVVHGGPRIITCGNCGSKSQLQSVDKPDVPRNSSIFGQITPPRPVQEHYHTCMQAPNFCSFVDQVSRLCDGCFKRLADTTCHICSRYLCDSCWPTVHAEEHWQNHVPLSVNSAKLKVFGRCKIHRRYDIEFYCQDCSAYLCSQCISDRHDGRNHQVITVAEKNLELLTKLKDLQKEVEENMNRMEDTMQEVMDIKETIEKTSNSDFSKEIIQKYINFHGMLQVPDESHRQKLKHQEANKRIDLDNALTQLRRQIEMINTIFKDIKVISESELLLNNISVEEFFPMLLDMKYAPCILDRSNYSREAISTIEEQGTSFKEELLNDVKDYITINVPKTTTELINVRGQTNAELGHIEEPEKIRRPKNITVSIGKIVSGSPDEPRIRHRYATNFNLMRFPTARSHSAISEGCAYGVHLSHVKDPGEFYVIRTSARKQQYRIERLAPALVDRCGHAPKKLHKDELYLVECVLDRKWYRGRVVEVLTRRTPKEDSSVLIFNLDYGNTQVVPHSRLRVMPDLLQAEPAMALRCRLSECIPTNGKWCKQSAKLMIEMLRDGIVTMYVVRVFPDILEVDLTLKNEDVTLFDGELTSLRDSMVFMEYSILLTHPNANELKKSVTALYPYYFLPRVSSTFTGIITYVVSSTHLYMQKICIDTDYLMDLMERINTFYDLNSQKGYVYNPVIGMPCVAICTQDYLWYRAKIIDLPGHEMITVKYVDYGNEDTLSYKLVRKIKPEFRRFPPQAFLCALKDIIDPQDRNWRSDPKAYMQKMSEEVFQVKVTSEENEALGVELKLDPCCIQHRSFQPPPMIFRKKVSRPFLRIRPSALAGLNFNTDSLSDSSPGGKAAKLVELYDNAVKIDEEQRELDKNSDTTSDELDTETEDFRKEIKILEVTSPSNIFVSVQRFSRRMEELDKKLQEFYMFNVAKKNSPWVAGNKCAILSYNHGKWLRGFVKKVLDKDTVIVEYFDTVGQEEIPISSLRMLDPHFLSYPVGSVKCHLDGISPPETGWPEPINAFLIAELRKHDRVFMTKTGVVEDNPSLPIKLWVKIKEEGAQEPSGEKWVILNDLVAERVLEDPKKASASDDSTENPEGAAEQPAGSSNEDVDIYVFDENDFKLKNDESENVILSGNRCRLYDWIQPDISTVKFFVGEPTHVDDHGFIYVHDVERDGAGLELLQYSLYQFYKDTSPDPFDSAWAVNDICVAKYYIDNCWYRGKILEITGKVCQVLFVDYGHVEKCQISWLRRSTTFIETPALARKYQLYGVNPISDSGEWTPDVVDKIYETIVEKRCNITVVDNENDMIPFIYLRVCENDQDLAEYLVTIGMATFDSDVESVSDDSSDNPRNFFDDRLQDVEVFPVAPITQNYNSGYRPLDIPTVNFPFPIRITVVREYHICANIDDDESVYPRLRRSIASLHRMTEQMQILGDQQPLLNNVSAGVACLSLYGSTGTWHRAEIEGVDLKKDLVLVHYVDYGYTEYVTRDRIRTILPRWFDIPRMALNFKLYKLKKNPEIRRKRFLTALTESLSVPNLMVRIMQKCKDYYEVEIIQKDSTELVYQKLIDDGLLLPLEDDEIDYFDGFEFEDDDEDEEEEVPMLYRVHREPERPEEREEAQEREGPEDREEMEMEEREEIEEREGPEDREQMEMEEREEIQEGEEAEDREQMEMEEREEIEEREEPEDREQMEMEEREEMEMEDREEMEMEERDEMEMEEREEPEEHEERKEREGPEEREETLELEEAKEGDGPEEREGPEERKGLAGCDWLEERMWREGREGSGEEEYIEIEDD